MAVRKPIYWDGSAIRSMTAAQILAIKKRCVYLFGGSDRPVNLSYDAGNTGANIRRMLDTRDTASAEVVGGGSFPTPASTNDAAASTTYDYIALSQTDGSPSDPADTNNIAFPLYQESTNIFRAMTKDDMYDTFINDAIDLLIDGSDRDGTYKISTEASTLANHTKINSNPIFIDQRFNATAVHGDATSGTTVTQEILPLSGVDQPVTIQNYYLWRTDQGTSYGVPSIQLPLQTNTDEDLVTYSTANFDALLKSLLFYSASARTSYRIVYDIEGSGVDAATISDNVSTPQTRGDAMVDTTLDGNVVVQDKDGADTYRSQRLPTGSPEVETTYTLKIYRK